MTAVEWLLNKIESKNGKEFSSYYTEFIEQAKAMEKEQIKDAWIATDNELQRLAAEQYYNETYGK
jgi:hypothetical protein